ncbi:phage/plasmid primase, P4 family [Allobaculum fili]|uniref:phage/plasmid primase, P4 family n=1 Tax=Allobaculum fili TaxID=2834460 RepID=UPI001E44B89A|nr:phage/plasmid primase, P4 family [Allobaculum fili]
MKGVSKLEDLKKQNIWICWTLKNGKKTPIGAYGEATSADPDKHGSTYVTYEEAMKAKEKRNYAGVAFVLPAGYFFLDIDNRSLDDSLTKRLMTRFKSYAEKSQSGNGYHIYGKCDPSQIPSENGKLSSRFYVKHPDKKLELYVGGLTKRFCCFTGDAINEYPLRESTQAVLVTYRHEMLRKKLQRKMVPEIDGDDEELFDIICDCRRFKNSDKFAKLYDQGDISDYGSHSEADLALCSMLAFRIGNCPSLIDTAFRNSALYRQKWERDDYRISTITGAVEGQNGNFYDPHKGMPDFIVLDDKKRPKVSPVKLVECLKERYHFIQVKNSGKETAQKYVYEKGRYFCYSDDMFRSLLKGLIEEYDPMFVNSHVINEALRLIMMQKDYVTHEQLDGNEDYINFENGLLYLPTLELFEHSPDVYSTIQIPCRWTGEPEDTPVFDKYMDDLFPGDSQSQKLVMQFMGVAISNIHGYRMKKALFMIGPGDTGKSQIRKFVEMTIGSYYCTSMELDDLEKRFGTSQMYGKRICGSADMRFSRVPELNIFKKATGGDSLPAEFKGEAAFEFVYKGVLWYCGNRLPRFGGDDGSWVYDRILPLECNNVIPKEKQDVELIDKMLAERQGVIFKAVLAAKEVVENEYRYTEPSTSIGLRQEFRQDNNSILAFMAECLEITDDTSCMEPWCTSGKVYDIYARWCQDNGRRAKSSSEFRKQLSSELNKPYPALVQRKNTGRFFNCIRLTDEAIHEYRSRVTGSDDTNSEFSPESSEESPANNTAESTNTCSSQEEDFSFLDDPDLPF